MAVPHIRLATAALLLAGSGAAVAPPRIAASVFAAAPAYRAERAGEVVRLEDARGADGRVDHAVVGNKAFEMKVKGQNVLLFPVCIGRGLQGQRRRRFQRDTVSRSVGEQARRAGVLRERPAVCVRHGAWQRPRRDPDSRVSDDTNQWQVVEVKADGKSAWVTSRLEFYRNPAWMKQFPFAHTIEMTYRLQDGVLEVTNEDRKPEHGADAGGDRLPSLLSADRFHARRLDGLGRREDAVAAGAEQDPDRRDASRSRSCSRIRRRFR